MMTFPQFFGSRATFRLFGSCAWVVFFLLALAPPGHAAGLTPGPPQTVTETRIQRTVFEYVMQISVTNSDTKTARGVIATVTSNSPRTTIVEGSVTFGSIAPGLAAAGADTFTLRHDRTVPFDPAGLQWTFVKVPADPTVAAPSSPTMLTSATVAGTTDAGASLEIVGGAQTITGVFNLSVPLQANRLNPLFVTAFNPAGRSAPVPVAVLQDAQPPTLFLDFPENGAQLTTDTIVVGGRVGDMLSGYQGLTVAVNGQSATVNVGIGNNGNTVSIPSITVHRVPLTGPRMTALSGDMQNAPMHARLAQPLVVKMTNADGTPFAGKLVTFTVTRSDGRLAADPAQTAPGTLLLQIPTDASGLAKTWWNVGADAGRANNRVTVTSKDIAGTVAFCSSADPGPVHQINIGTGHNQKAEAGGPAPEPLRAWASDMCNGINNLPITFTIKQGGGKVNGADSTTVNTGITGYAQATLTLGPDAGPNVIEPRQPQPPRHLHRLRSHPRPHQTHDLHRPHPGQHQQPHRRSDLQVSRKRPNLHHDQRSPRPLRLRPHISPIRPIGPLRPRPPLRRWPHRHPTKRSRRPTRHLPAARLRHHHHPQRQNSLPTPVLLPCMNVNNAKTYNGTTDLVLTCEGIAGLKMTIKANSMRKPDGTLVSPTNTALVSLNQVHHDQIPMPMPDGASPPFAWTLQPGGAHFDPPIAIEYPNMSGLPAGAIAYFLSFNHDTERFEIVASGHVTPDASTILSDPGAGLTIAGWGCNCPPYSVTGNCRKCDAPNPNRAIGSVGSFTDKNPIVPDDTSRFGLVCGYTQTPHTVVAVCGCDANTGEAVAHARCNFEVIYKAYNKAITNPEDIATVTAHENQHVANWQKAFDRIYPHALEIDGKHYTTHEECDAEVAQFNDFAAFVLGLAESDNTALDFYDKYITFACDRILFFHRGLAADAATASFRDYSFPDVTSSFTFTVDGQSISANELASYELKNISAPDLFGSGGPGTPPDFISDDYVRVVGVSTIGDTNRYAFSERFQIQRGQTYSISNLTFTDTPPRKPDMLAAAPDALTLTALGQTTQVRVTATFVDRTTGDVTPASSWTSYRTSNAGVARIDTNGLVTATGKGIAFITAVNEGATAVTGLVVQQTNLFTSVRGFVRSANGQSASGATVRLSEFSLTTTSATDGSFAFNGVPATTASLTVRAEAASGQTPERILAPLAGGIVDAGILVLPEASIPTVPSPTPEFPGVALGGGVAMATKPSLAGTIVADSTFTLQSGAGGGVTMCYLGKTRKIPSYLTPRFVGAGARSGSCTPPEATENQSGRIRSVVIRRDDSGTLDFYYQLFNDNTQADFRYDFFRLTIPGFTSSLLEVSYRPDGLAGLVGAGAYATGVRNPLTADRDVGSVGNFGFSFNSPPPTGFLGSPACLHSNETSRFIVVRTSATAFGQAQALVSTADTLGAQVFVPTSSPAPAPEVPPLLDSDGDGIPDAQELLAGTDPRDPASVLRLSPPDKTATGMQMQFPTLTGKTYRVEYTDDLTTNQWHPLTAPIPGDGQPVIVEDPAATTRLQRFYRLKLVQP